MKEGIHPKYQEVEARCACGNTFKTRSTKPELHLEICSNCHPFFTGRQKLIDTEGRVERFNKKFGLQTSELAGTQRRPANVPETFGTPAGTAGDWVKTIAVAPVAARTTTAASAFDNSFMKRRS